jgi:hypothetical protein
MIIKAEPPIDETLPVAELIAHVTNYFNGEDEYEGDKVLNIEFVGRYKGRPLFEVTHEYTSLGKKYSRQDYMFVDGNTFEETLSGGCPVVHVYLRHYLDGRPVFTVYSDFKPYEWRGCIFADDGTRLTEDELNRMVRREYRPVQTTFF